MLSHSQLLQAILRETSLEMLKDYGLAVHSAAAADGEQLAAAIGFTAAGYRGSLALAISKQVLENGRPAATTTALSDWTAELSNQLLGRVKNRLLMHGPALTLALPVSISGSSLRIAASDDPLALCHEFDNGALRVIISVVFDVGFEFTPSQGEPPAEPGALVLF